MPLFGTFLPWCFGILSPSFALGHGISFLEPFGFGISKIEDHFDFPIQTCIAQLNGIPMTLRVMDLRYVVEPAL